MFTGLVDARARLFRTVRRGRLLELVVAAPRAYRDIRAGASVCVNGCCLTVKHHRAGKLAFDLIPETLKRTSLGGAVSGDVLNLERPLRWRGRVEGHLVQGHVDGTAVLLRRRVRGRSVSLELRVPKRLSRYLIEKGSVALNGVSLTVGRVSQGRFWVHLVPHTLKMTNLASALPGHKLNIEADLWLKRRGH